MQDGTFTFNRVLVIDDDESDNFIIRRILSSSHAAKDIIVKNSAIVALELIRNCETDALPQIIFLDLNMPLMNGFEFLDEYEKLSAEVKNSCRVVVLSNHFSELHKQQLSENKNVAKYYLKPFEEKYISEIASLR